MDLGEIRKEIDEIDKSLVESFEKRLALCRDVAEYKIKSGMQVLDRKREGEKLEQVRNMASSDFNRYGINELFTQIMSISRKLQYQLLADKGVITGLPFEMVPNLQKSRAKVVYQGVEGAYSHAAALQFFGEKAKLFNVKTWDDAMKAICAGTADFAVLPIENSSAGSVANVYDLLVKFDNYIVGETYVKVDHVLLGLPDAEISDIEMVYSHPQGLMQCSTYLEEHREWNTYSTSNTALSAKRVKEEGNKAHAAIASEMAGELYGLKILDRNVMNNRGNTTRFIIVASRKLYEATANKISVCFETKHENAALYNMLSHLTYNGLNMLKLESRPITGRPWEFRFFVDFEGNLGDAGVKNALRGILEEANYFRILGNYYTDKGKSVYENK
ncbi:bifunctional chorismate mutase/prephenate dehydratase [Fusibacillus kribbianus]|uniref:Bifunctional chorismate mutase/prephenate dehydratase n=1 Tax=Fusibacillus kribbianus TaxID=3044208 RepID=A0AAP4BCV0_9FIRM|nr:bifunctional chorismate mutase/prephenate dehydratase [Ruminococcus sp. YH-rum2234]MDI9242828.1 prephenate dehydratase domain-containing protein [Ruminococcus sp. YH-rum2234]